MKAIVRDRYGPPAVLQLEDVATPEPGSGDVIVRVHAASINDWDWEMLRGELFVIRLMYGLFTPKVRLLGCDVAGRVEAVGNAVTTFGPGDHVYGDMCMTSGRGGSVSDRLQPVPSARSLPDRAHRILSLQSRIPNPRSRA